MLKVWGRTNSVNVQKVMWCIAELGLEHERTDAGMQHGLNKEDWYLEINPNGLVPVIDDDGFTLWESNTIVRYLAAKHGRLGADEIGLRARAESWMDWQLTVLNAPMTAVFWNLVRTPAERRDMGAVEQGVKQAAAAFALLDRHLSDKTYITGDELSIGDIPVGAMTYRWYALDVDHPEHPNVRAWYERLSERPAFRQHVMLPLT